MANEFKVKNGLITPDVELQGATSGTTMLIASATASGTMTVPSGTDTLVAAGTGQTLTNKTINGTNNTISNVSLTAAVTGTLPIANGGTGQTTQTAAFDALSPQTTKGDLILHNGTDAVRLAVGATNGHVLTVDSAEATGVKWAAAAGGGGGSGTVTTVSVVSANGFAGTVATATTTPAITLTTSITGVLKGNGTAISAAVAGTDYMPAVRASTLTGQTSPMSWNSDSFDIYAINSLGNALTINADSGTPTQGRKILFRITDNGTARALTWTGGTKGFRAIGVTLPTTTVVNKTSYIGAVYNTDAAAWDVIAVTTQA